MELMNLKRLTLIYCDWLLVSPNFKQLSSNKFSMGPK